MVGGVSVCVVRLLVERVWGECGARAAVGEAVGCYSTSDRRARRVVWFGLVWFGGTDGCGLCQVVRSVDSATVRGSREKDERYAGGTYERFPVLDDAAGGEGGHHVPEHQACVLPAGGEGDDNAGALPPAQLHHGGDEEDEGRAVLRRGM